jgi:hypothetical protein
MHKFNLAHVAASQPLLEGHARKFTIKGLQGDCRERVSIAGFLRRTYQSWGAILMGLGFCLLLICLILCMHAYCVITVSDEEAFRSHQQQQPLVRSSSCLAVTKSFECKISAKIPASADDAALVQWSHSAGQSARHAVDHRAAAQSTAAEEGERNHPDALG